MQVTNCLSHSVEKADGLQRRRSGFMENFILLFVPYLALRANSQAGFRTFFKKFIVSARMYQTCCAVYIALGITSSIASKKLEN